MTKSEREMRMRLASRVTAAVAEDMDPVGQTVQVFALTEERAIAAARKRLSLTFAGAYMWPILHVETVMDRLYEVTIQTGWTEGVRS